MLFVILRGARDVGAEGRGVLGVLAAPHTRHRSQRDGPESVEAMLGPPKRGVCKPAVDHFPQFRLI